MITELIRNVSLIRKIRLENMVRFGFDVMEKVIIGSVEQVGDDRYIIITTKPFAAAQQRVKTRAVCRWAHARPCWRHILNARDNRRTENVVQRRGRGTMQAQHSHRIQQTGAGWLQCCHLIGGSQLVVHSEAQNTKAGQCCMPDSGGGSAPFRLAENMICLVFSQFSLRFLPAAHACRCASHPYTCSLHHQAQPYMYRPRTWKFCYCRRRE